MIFTVEVVLFQYRIPVELRRLVLLYWYLPTVESKIIYNKRLLWATPLQGLVDLINRAKKMELSDWAEMKPYPEKADENRIYCQRLSVPQHLWQSCPLWKQFREDYEVVNKNVYLTDVFDFNPWFEKCSRYSQHLISIDVDVEK